MGSLLSDSSQRARWDHGYYRQKPFVRQCLVYGRLHQMAAARLAKENNAHSLHPTALLQEAFVEILEADVLKQAPNRAYLFGAFSRAMRHILTDHARRPKT